MKLVRDLHIKFQGFKVKKEIYNLVLHTVCDAIATVDDEESLEMLRRDLLEAVALVKKKQGMLWAQKHGYVQNTVKCNDL